MTTSTDNKNMKTPKAKGPIRTEAVIPIIIIMTISFLYFRFVFDRNIKTAIEYAGTHIHGAEVNLDDFQSSFLGGYFSLHNLQVTDKEEPERNLLQIGEIRFGFLWDALLRAKIVIPEAAIKDIQIYSIRKRAGYVRPPAPPSSTGEVSEIEKIEKNVLEQAQKDNSQNALGDLAALLAGTDDKDVLKNIQGSLKAEARIEELKKELKEKEKVWKERLANLPKKEEFEELSKRAKLLKFDTKDPKQFAADIKEAGKIVKEADAKIDNLKASSKDLKGDVENYNNAFKQIDDMVKQDIKDLEQRLKIPDLNLGDFSKSIFTKMLTEKLGSVQKYAATARQYMPPPKDPNAPKENELIPPKRGAGKNYSFPITTGYPLFWLKRAAISSEPTENGFSGRISGELTNVTTDPTFINKPAILDVKGDFPKSEVFGVNLKVIADHIREPRETVTLTVQSFPLQEYKLLSDGELNLGIQKATGQTNLQAEVFNQNFQLTLNNRFEKINYDVKAKSKAVSEAITTILNGIPVVTLNASARGTLNNLDMSINSNLGSELSRGLKSYVQAKVDAMKKQIRDYVDNKIKGEREKLDGEFNKIKGQTDKMLGEKQAELEKAKSEVKESANTKKSSGGDKVKDDLKEKGKKLLKGFKF